MKYHFNYQHYRVLAPQGKHGKPTEEELTRWMKGVKHEIKPAPRGGLTICTILDEKDNAVAVGEAYCSRSDQFSYDTGLRKATKRAILALLKGLGITNVMERLAPLFNEPSPNSFSFNKGNWVIPSLEEELSVLATKVVGE